MAYYDSYSSHPLPVAPSHAQYEEDPDHDQHDYAVEDTLFPSAPAEQPHHHQPPALHLDQPQQDPAALHPHLQRPATQETKHPRHKRGFSFRSDKSNKSNDKTPTTSAVIKGKVDYHETHAEKKKLHTKADPTLAISEMEPSAMAQTAGGDLNKTPLRSIQHKDHTGAPIVDPDRSNPTRSRWERPLDTIRSFEAAIDGGYNRQSLYRVSSDAGARAASRSSYYGSMPPQPTHPRLSDHLSYNSHPDNGARFPHESYYGSRPSSNLRLESGAVDPRSAIYTPGPRDSYTDGYESAPPAGNGNGYNYGNGAKSKPSRSAAEPGTSGRAQANRNMYPLPNNHRSYETVASGSGASTSLGEPSGYQTDLTSSENSSINRRSPSKIPEPINDYGISFGQAQSSVYQPPRFDVTASQPRIMPAESPPVPKKIARTGSMLRKISRDPGARPESGEKRKSWFARRFSKTS